MTDEEMIALLEGMMNDRLQYRDKLLKLKAAGATYDWDDGRDIDDAIAREDAAVKNLKRAADRLRR